MCSTSHKLCGYEVIATAFSPKLYKSLLGFDVFHASLPLNAQGEKFDFSIHAHRSSRTSCWGQ